MTGAQVLRVGEQDVDALVRQLWFPQETADWPIRVTSGELPDTHRSVEEYAVLPNRRRPRFLLPLRSGRAVSAALGRHLATGSTSTRWAGRAAAAAWATGLGEGLTVDRLIVGLHRAVPDSQAGEWRLLARVAELLDEPDLVAVIPVRRAMPNSKPTARLFTRSGSALGHAKIGWSPSTRRLVRNETRTLQELDGGLPWLRTPRVLAGGDWHGLELLVASPLPAALRPQRGRPEAMTGTLVTVARTGHWSRGRLAASTYLADLRSRLDAAAANELEVCAALSRLLDGVVACDPVLTYGRWHGDWVPWNLGRARDHDVAWDWEYSAECAPLGFDLLHWHFQQRLARPEGSLAAAVTALDEAAAGLSVLGVAPEQQRALASLYLVEILARAALLAAEGSGWNPRLHPALLDVVRRREAATT